MAYPDLNDEQKLFIATVAGEAGGNGENAQRAVAHIIMNRVGHERFNNYATVDKVITPPDSLIVTKGQMLRIKG